MTIAKYIPRCTRREWIRFFNRLSINNNCWIWNGAKSGGYGQFSFRGDFIRTHRFSYTQLIKSVPQELVLDHICKNKLCANPKHLRVVTAKQNVLENSNSIPAMNKVKINCSKGHLLDTENVIAIHRSNGSIERLCRACHKESNRNWFKNKAYR